MAFDKVSIEPSDPPRQRIPLDERFISLLLPDPVHERIEGQELRQLVLASLRDLTPEEHRVVELRYQHKKSRGQVASQLKIDRGELMRLEKSALEKLRGPIRSYMEE